MKCPYCNSHHLKVNETRETGENNTRRRKECLKCKNRFTTYEFVEKSQVSVVKKGGHKEDFDKDKIEQSIKRSYDKRLIPENKVNRIVLKLTNSINKGKNRIITSEEIGEMILDELKKIDELAYLRFSYVFHNFDGIGKIKEEIKRLEKNDVSKQGK